MSDPKPNPPREHWFNRMYDHRSYDVQGGRDVDPHGPTVHSRHRTSKGKMYRIRTHVLAAVNFLMLAGYIGHFFVSADEQGKLSLALRNLLGNVAFSLFMITTVLMMLCFGIARANHEFLNSEEDDIDSGGGLTQTWVYFGGAIFLFFLLFTVIRHFA